MFMFRRPFFSTSRIADPPMYKGPVKPKTGNFKYKVTTFEKDFNSNKIRKISGYSDNQDIVLKTFEYCTKTKGSSCSCSDPIISTASTDLQNTIEVYEYDTRNGYIVFL